MVLRPVLEEESAELVFPLLSRGTPTGKQQANRFLSLEKFVRIVCMVLLQGRILYYLGRGIRGWDGGGGNIWAIPRGVPDLILALYLGITLDGLLVPKVQPCARQVS